MIFTTLVRYSFLSAGFAVSLGSFIACSPQGAESQQTGPGVGEVDPNAGQDDDGPENNGEIDPIGTDPPPVMSNDDRDLDVREQVCDEAGENCTCLRMALLGTLDSAANEKDSQPFVDWLNGNSGGTATVETITTKPTMDATFLAQYDILLVANVNGWTFSEAEKLAVAEWSKTTGGGIISLTGFVSKDSEETFTSQLIEFSGISYNSTLTAQNASVQTIKYKERDVNMYCIGPALITAPVEFGDQEGALAGLTYELDYVGAYVGYGIDVPADGSATTIATDPVSGEVIAAAKEVDGAGRVFAWGDEWAIFANQWESEPANLQMDEYNDCYEPASGVEGEEGYEPAFLHTVASLYQVKQFWYNVINWVAPPNECGFTIEDEDVVVIVK